MKRINPLAILIFFSLLFVNRVQAYSAYVADSGEEVIFVIDTTTNSVVDVVTSGLYPPFMLPYSTAVSLDSKTLYVGDIDSQLLYVIDTDPNSGTYNTITNVVSVPEDASPFSLGLTPDGSRIYVAGSDPSGVFVFDTTSQTFTESVTGIVTDGLLLDLAVYQDGSYAYAVDYENGYVYAIDTDPESGSYNTVINAFSTIFPTAIAFTPDGGYAYISGAPGSTGEGYVGILNADPNSMDWNEPVGELNVGIFTAFSFPFSMSINPSGDTIYVIDAENFCVYTASTETGNVIHQTSVTINMGQPYCSVAVVPDDSSIYITGQESYVNLMNPNTFDLTTVTNTSDYPFIAVLGTAFTNPSSTPNNTGIYDLNRLRPIYNAEVQAATSILNQAGFP